MLKAEYTIGSTHYLEKNEHLSLLTPVRKYKKMQSISSGMMTGMHLPETIMKRRP